MVHFIFLLCRNYYHGGGGGYPNFDVTSPDPGKRRKQVSSDPAPWKVYVPESELFSLKVLCLFSFFLGKTTLCRRVFHLLLPTDNNRHHLLRKINTNHKCTINNRFLRQQCPNSSSNSTRLQRRKCNKCIFRLEFLSPCMERSGVTTLAILPLKRLRDLRTSRINPSNQFLCHPQSRILQLPQINSKDTHRRISSSRATLLPIKTPQSTRRIMPGRKIAICLCLVGRVVMLELASVKSKNEPRCTPLKSPSESFPWGS